MNVSYIKAGCYLIDGITENQPFPAGRGGCEQFRIPGLIRLKNGDLFATVDARWNCAKTDFGGIDTMFAISKDNGRTWTGGYAAYFPDTDGTPKDPTLATTCIDSTPIQTPDGRLHIFVNMNPSGITTGLHWPHVGTGYILVNGQYRLALTDVLENANDDPNSFPYYVGDFAEGHAPVFGRDGIKTKWQIDEWFNLEEDVDGRKMPVYQTQEETTKIIQQNIFYRSSVLHVYNTMYPLHLISEDGKEWHPELLSCQLKKERESATILSPGNGVVSKDGIMYLPLYAPQDKMGDYYGTVAMAYSSDNGVHWKRTSFVPVTDTVNTCGESKPVELPDGTIRLFLRNNNSCIAYADYHPKTNIWDNPVALPIGVHADVNMGAYAEKNKIYVSWAEGRGPEHRNRANGCLYTFTLTKENQMELTGRLEIEPDSFSYVVVAPTSDGHLAILWDTCDDGLVWFKKLDTVKIE